jgi:hypothetical protein
MKFTIDLLTVDELGENGLYFPREEVQRALYNFMEGDSNARYGTLWNEGDSDSYNVDNISHEVIDSWFKGNVLTATIKILDTPCGAIVKRLLDPPKLTPIAAVTVSQDGVVSDMEILYTTLRIT